MSNEYVKCQLILRHTPVSSKEYKQAQKELNHLLSNMMDDIRNNKVTIRNKNPEIIRNNR